MNNILTFVQILISALLVIAVLLQQKGAGLGSAFGGDSGNIYSTRRGAEKILFYATTILAVLFIAIAVVRTSL